MGWVYPLYKDPYERISIDISLEIQFVTLLSPSWRLLTLSPTIMEVENGCIWKVTSNYYWRMPFFAEPWLWEEPGNLENGRVFTIPKRSAELPFWWVLGQRNSCRFGEPLICGWTRRPGSEQCCMAAWRFPRNLMGLLRFGDFCGENHVILRYSQLPQNHPIILRYSFKHVISWVLLTCDFVSLETPCFWKIILFSYVFFFPMLPMILCF